MKLMIEQFSLPLRSIRMVISSLQEQSTAQSNSST